MTHHVETKVAAEPQVMPPCQHRCPLHQDIRGYVALVAQGRLDDAAALIRRDNPLSSICGTICAHPCEEECRRLTIDDAISIRGLKRFVMENAPNPYAHKKLAPSTGKKVAIIGAGPSGLVAAHDLALAGHSVTVFDRHDDEGGAVRWGVPSYRLPIEIIRKDVDAIAAMGVEFKTGMDLGANFSIDDLEKDGFDAVVLMMGLSDSRGLPITNNDHPDVLMALPFLKAARNGESMINKGSNVVVIGSGNVAMDVARTAVRFGAGKVKIACLEKPHQMPASPWEIEEAIEEGIEMDFCGWGPNAVTLDSEGKVNGLECRECVNVFDEEGRFNPTYNDENLQTAEGDTVIFAIGQGSIINYLKDMGIELNERGLLKVDKNFMTNRNGVFSGGEIIKGPGPAVAAMAHARQTAKSVDAFLQGVEYVPDVEPVKIGELEQNTRDNVKKQDRQELHLLQVNARIDNFTPIEVGFTPEEAVKEARRCMSCGAGAEWIRGKCAFCLNCVRVCPYGVPVVTEASRVDIRFDQCQGCGICFPACPGDAIGFHMLGVAEIQPRMKVAIDEAKSHNTGGPTIAVIYCDFDAYDVTDLRRIMKEKHAGKALVGIPCLAKLKALDLMRAFEFGANGVLVVGCPDEECTYQEGEYWGSKRVSEAKKLLAELDMGNRIDIKFVSGLKLDQFDRTVAEFEEKIKSL